MYLLLVLVLFKLQQPVGKQLPPTVEEAPGLGLEAKLGRDLEKRAQVLRRPGWSMEGQGQRE